MSKARDNYAVGAFPGNALLHLFALLLSVSAFAADTSHIKDSLFLKSGRRLDGNIQSVDDREVIFRMNIGPDKDKPSIVTLPRNDIEKVENRQDLRKDYAERIEKTKKQNTAAAWKEFGAWCRKHALAEDAEKAAVRAAATTLHLKYEKRLKNAQRQNNQKVWKEFGAWCRTSGLRKGAEYVRKYQEKLAVSVAAQTVRDLNLHTVSDVSVGLSSQKARKKYWEWYLEVNLKKPVYLFEYIADFRPDIGIPCTRSGPMPNTQFAWLYGKQRFTVSSQDKKGIFENHMRKILSRDHFVQYTCDTQHLIRHRITPDGKLSPPIQVRSLTKQEKERAVKARARYQKMRQLLDTDKDAHVKVATSFMRAILKGKSVAAFTKQDDYVTAVTGLRTVGSIYVSTVLGTRSVVTFPVILVTQGGLLKETYVTVYLQASLEEPKWYVVSSLSTGEEALTDYRPGQKIVEGIYETLRAVETSP